MTPTPNTPLTSEDVTLLKAVTCSACRRPVTECIGQDVCEGAAKGQAAPYPPEELVPYDPKPAWAIDHIDYRSDALSRDPALTCSVERMCGSFQLSYVVRNRNDRLVTLSASERGVWAGASGATKNSRYDPNAPFKPWSRPTHAAIPAAEMWKRKAEADARRAAR